MDADLIIAGCALLLSALCVAVICWRFPSLRPAPEVKGIRYLQWLLRNVFVFWILIAGAFIVIGTEAASAFVRAQIRRDVRKASELRAQAFVGDKLLPDDLTQELVFALSRLRFNAAHRSSPTDEATVRLNFGSEDLVLRLAKDSQRRGEFWVYSPSFSELQEIGRIDTALLGKNWESLASPARP